jgi:hypothetical protein
MRKLRARILAGGAVAVLAGATAFAVTSTAGATTTARATALTAAPARAGTTAKADTTARTGTTLSVAAGQPAIKAGERDTISGTLLAGDNPAANRVVELYRYNDERRRWRLVRVKLTGQDGTVTFTVRPGITRQYELTYRGNSALAPATSGKATVTVTS